MFGFFRDTPMQIAWLAGCLVTFGGILMYIASAPGTARIILAFFLLVCLAIFIINVVVGLFPSPKKVTGLAQAIHIEISRLVANNCNLLVPCGVDHETAQLQITLDEGVTTVTRIGWSGIQRQYEIRYSGRIARRLIWNSSGPRPYCQDRWWLYSPLTMRRLQYLLYVLQHDYVYSPRQRIASRA